MQSKSKNPWYYLQVSYKIRFIEEKIDKLFEAFPIISLIGPRQCGKSTLLEHYSRNSGSKWKYFNLDFREIRNRIQADPRLFMKDLDSNVIIDEAQKVPDLFHALKALVDSKFSHKIIISGSTNYLMLDSVTESMSGRVGILEMLPFSLAEALELKSNKIIERFFSAKDINQLKLNLKEIPELDDRQIINFIFKGGFPKIHEIKSEEAMSAWFDSYLTTYIDKDVRDIANISDLENFQNLYKLLAYQITNLLNFSNIANDIGLESKTIKKYFSLLEATYHYKKVYSFRQDFKEKITKTPKVFSIDTGMMNYLINNYDKERMLSSGYWSRMLENWIFTELYKQISFLNRKKEINFYRTRNDSEIDFILSEGKTLIPIEVKSGTQVKPMQLRALKTFINDYSCNFHIPFGIVFHRTDTIYSLAENILALPLYCLV